MCFSRWPHKAVTRWVSFRCIPGLAMSISGLLGGGGTANRREGRKWEPEGPWGLGVEGTWAKSNVPQHSAACKDFSWRREPCGLSCLLWLCCPRDP